MATPQTWVARTEVNHALASAVFTRKIEYQNGEADWSGFKGHSVVLIGITDAYEVPSELWDIADQVKGLPNIPEDLTKENGLSWAKSNVRVLHRVKDQPGGAVAAHSAEGYVASPAPLAVPSPPDPIPEPVSADFSAVLTVDEAQLLLERQAAQEALIKLLERERELSEIIRPDPEPMLAIPEDAEREAEFIALHSIETSPRSQVFSVEPEEWGRPTDFWTSEKILPEVTHDCLPPAFADFALDQARIVGVDPVQTALNCWVLAAASIRESIGLQMIPDNPRWVERARLWGAIVGDPSTKKGPAFDAVSQEWLSIAAELHGRQERQIREYEEQAKIHEHRMDQWRRGEAKQPGSSQRPEAPERPLLNRLWTDDATKEKLSEMLSAHARGKLLIVKDELASWFAFDQYKANGGSDRPDFLSSYEGRERHIDRIGQGRSVHVPSWSLCILGGIQPAILATVREKLGFDGMLQRFQIVLSAPAGEGEDAAPDYAAQSRWAKACRALVDLDIGTGPIRFSPAAQEHRRACASWIFQTLKATSNPSLAAALGKWEGLYGRLANTAHCLEAADQGLGVPTGEVSLRTVEIVWAWMQKILWPNAVGFYEGQIDGELARHVKWVAGLILARKWQQFTSSDLYDCWTGYRRLKTASDKKAFHDQLDLSGWVRPFGNTKHGFSTKWTVNPAVHDGRFAEQAALYERERRMFRDAIESAKARKAAREPGADDD